ncbi:MAG: GAF domain-containing protein, partial [Anaerolineae bacterium]|nr:GAF domain-containing protein [Anaerolineae bacterium]
TEARVLKDRLKRVLNISVRMNETRDAASLLKFVMDQVIELSGAERGYLVLLNKSGEFEFKVAVGIDLEALEQHKAQISYTVLGTVAQSRAPVLLQDALTDERFGAQSSVLELNLRSVLCVPLISGADLTGMIYADNRSVSGRFSQADLDLMMIFANQAATAIENARLYEGLVNANQELETWAHTLEERVTQRTEELQAANTDLSRRAVQMQTSSQVSQQVTSILDLNTLLSRVVNLIQTQFGYYFAGVWLYDEAQAALILRAGTGEAGEKLIKQSFSIPLNAASIVASVCRDGNRRLVESVDEVPDFMWVEGLLDIASEVALPMRIGEHVLGVLDIASDHTAAFSSDDQLVLQSLADQIAVAIRNAQLYESEQTRRQLAELLERTGRALSSSMTYDEVPNLILELLHTLIPYERGLILLKKGSILKPVAHYGFPDDRQATEMKIPINEGDVFRTLSSARHTLIIDDVTQEPGWTQMPWLPLNHSWLGIPMISRDDVIGMLSLTREAVGAFTPEDARLVEAFGTQAVIALENARLYSEIKGFNEKLEQMVKVRTAELNTAYTNLERLDKTKSDFINVAAHELRTPLTVVKGYTQLFKHYATYEKDPQLEKAMHGIVSGVDRLHEIINSMLDVAKIDSQTLKMFKEKIEIADIVQRVCAGFTSILAERELVLSTDGVDKLSPIQADPDLLAKVFYQLIVNAIKYTPDGGEIKLAGHQGYDEDGQGYVEIVISDTGIGINPEDQELIFEKFYQTGEIEFHSSGRTKFKGGGPGLGLAIARGIIVAHQGRIWVESPGCDEEHCPGSQFHIRLPL